MSILLHLLFLSFLSFILPLFSHHIPKVIDWPFFFFRLLPFSFLSLIFLSSFPAFFTIPFTDELLSICLPCPSFPFLFLPLLSGSIPRSRSFFFLLFFPLSISFRYWSSLQSSARSSHKYALDVIFCVPDCVLLSIYFHFVSISRLVYVFFIVSFLYL